MPYAEWTTKQTHLPSRKYPHYALLIDSVDIERRYIWENEHYSLTSTIDAGIYGFTNLSERDSFISLANRSSESEVAFIAAIAAVV